MKTNTQVAVDLLIKLAVKLTGTPVGKLVKGTNPLTVVKNSTAKMAKPPKPPPNVAATNVKVKSPATRQARPPQPVNPGVKPGGQINPGSNVVS